MDNQIIREIMTEFFNGGDYFDEPEIGFIWVAKHGCKEIDFSDVTNVPENLKLPSAFKRSEKNPNKYIYSEFETLTIEPREGGQYEVAIRIWSEGQWRGYKINDFDSNHYLLGIGTRGH